MFGPVDFHHRKRRQLDMLSRPPVPRGNDEIAYVLVGVVGEEVLHVAEVAVRGVDVIAVYRGDALEVRIAVGAMALRVRRLTRCGLGKDQRLVQVGLHLLRHRLIFSRLRACLDLLNTWRPGNQCPVSTTIHRTFQLWSSNRKSLTAPIWPSPASAGHPCKPVTANNMVRSLLADRAPVGFGQPAAGGRPACSSTVSDVEGFVTRSTRTGSHVGNRLMCWSSPSAASTPR